MYISYWIPVCLSNNLQAGDPGKREVSFSLSTPGTNCVDPSPKGEVKRDIPAQKRTRLGVWGRCIPPSSAFCSTQPLNRSPWCLPALGRASTLLGPQAQMLISPSRNILTPPEIKFPLGKLGSLKLTHEIDHHSLVTHLFSLSCGNDQIFRNYGQG